MCRRDVRNSLHEGNLLVFICGAQNGPLWRYFYVGFGTVRALIERTRLWINPCYAEYRPFYNVLARIEGQDLVQHETFHKYHDDWQRRAEAPYALFDPENSKFNLSTPLQVASWQGQLMREPFVHEKWERDGRVQKLEQFLFKERGIEDRRLRTSGIGFGHAKLNPASKGRRRRPGRSLEELRSALGQFP